MKRPNPSAFASPVLIGAVTVLVVLVAVFLAYNANAGLPFVPTRELRVQLADGSDLVVGNDVREGGFRVGLVSQMKPVRLPSGQTGAEVVLQLSKANGNVPADSSASVRPLSLLGLEYVDISRGRSKQIIADGGTLPITQTVTPVALDQVLETFNDQTRVAMQQNLAGLGDAVAGRGSSINNTIASLPPLFTNLEPVAAYLSDPATQLTRFLVSLNQFMAAVAPVSPTLVAMLGHTTTTLAALSRDPAALTQSIAQAPSTLAQGTTNLRVSTPFLADLTTLGGYLTPATVELVRALPNINPAIEEGTPVLRRLPSLNTKLQQVMDSLQALAQAPGTNVAINALVGTVDTLNPVLRYIGPFQTVCDYWNYWWTYLAEDLDAVTSTGFAQRVLVDVGAIGSNGVGNQGAYAPANGTTNYGFGYYGGVEYLHAQPYGAAVDPQGNADCEAGQRGYPRKINSFDPQGRDLALDPRTPGDQGPTFAGRPRVPAGETFTRTPQTGPQLPPDPSNP